MTGRTWLSATAALLTGMVLLPAGQAVAQSASAQAMLMEEIVVTARRREESLQDLPLSIAAISADAMEAQGIYTIENVSDFVPNVTLTTSLRENNTRVIIRGIGGGHPDPVFVWGSGMYVDGHYIPQSLGGYMSTMDIDRVEVLRGPQGTLFGKNVTGGAVVIVTAKPGPEFDSSVTLRMADDGQQDLRGMINFPISDNLFARIGVASEQFDGYYYNRNLNIDTGGTDTQALNAALRYTPTDNWTLDFTVNTQKLRHDNKGVQCNNFDGSASAWGSRGPDHPSGPRPPHLDRFYYDGMTLDHQAACNSDAAAGTYITSSDKVTFSNVDAKAAFFTAQWNSDGPVGGLDDLNFKAIASYRGTNYHYLQDRDGMFYDIDNVGTAVWSNSAGGNVGQDNWTRGWELLIEAQANDRLEFTVGVNSFHELAKNGDGACRRRFNESGFGEVGPAIPFEPPQPAPGNAITDGVNCDDVISGLMFEIAPSSFIPFINSARVENESFGVFANLTYALNDNWDLDIGARMTEDDREFWNLEAPVSGCETDDPSLRSLGSQPDAESGICTFSWDVTFESAIYDGFYNEAQGSFDEVTPMVSLTRNLAGGDTIDSGMVYFLYSEGFLTGGFNTEVNSNLPAVASLLTYNPEYVKNYEVGFKGTLLDGRVRLMADIFFMDYTDKQDSIDLNNQDGSFGPDEDLNVTQNVSEVDISGIEVELRTSPWEGGFLSVDLGILDNEYGSYAYPDPTDPAFIIDQTNTTIQDITADWTLNVGVEHQFQLDNGGTITPRLNIYTQDGYDYNASSRDAPPSPCYQDGYTKVGARVTYVPPAGNWRASLFGNNITDEKILLDCGDSRGVYRYVHQRPAYWGLEFTMDWGASAQ